METNFDEVRSASPSTFTLSTGRNNRLSLLSGSDSQSVVSSLAERTRSPPPSYDGLSSLPPDRDFSATLDAHLPLTISNKGWAEVESVSKQFLAENLPGWTASMQGSGERGSSTTGQQKQISQLIKAGIRKSRRGLVLRLLRRTQDVDEIADLRLDTDTKPTISHGLEPLAELEATPALKAVHQVPGIHEAPNEPMVYELPTSATTVPRPVDTDPNQYTSHHEEPVSSPTESLLDTLSFGPEEASAWSEPVIDTSDLEQSPSSSIVPTPTNGLSVRHATHRTFKRSRPDDTDQGGARRLPLDVESINRRLLESHEGVSQKDLLKEKVGPHTAPDMAPSMASHETKGQQKKPMEDTVEQSVVEYPSRSLERDVSQASARSVDGRSSTGSNDNSTPEPESISVTTRSASGLELARTNHCVPVPEVPTLKISTSYGVGFSNTSQGIIAARPSYHTPSSSSTRVGIDHHMYMGEPEDDGQNTIDGSVTLPTLNLPEPDSPGGSLWLPSNAEIRPSPEKQSPLYSLISHASIAVLSQIGYVASGLYELYGPEKAVSKDHVRVRWTCVSSDGSYTNALHKLTFFCRHVENSCTMTSLNADGVLHESLRRTSTDLALTPHPAAHPTVRTAASLNRARSLAATPH